MTWLPGMAPGQGLTDTHDGSNDTWLTPTPIAEAVAQALGGIDLDPCAHPLSPVWALASHRICLQRGGNGLTDPWPGCGGVFANVPFSDVPPWLTRCKLEARKRPVVMLIPTRPETRAWQAHVWQSGAVIVQQVGRIRFVGSDGNVHGNGMVTTCFVCWDLALAHRLRLALRDKKIDAFVLRVSGEAEAESQIQEKIPW